ncbi:histidine phosphatase family protein [Luminiphilus sp.]|nr:histidine phosphatase family protein [Luminiphilus sp.]
MKLFVLRHGMTTESITDEGRELSDRGAVEVENVLSLRLHELRQISAMYSSPLLRVRQTINVAKGVLDFRGEIHESHYLKTGSRLNEIKGFVAQLDFDGGDILVSSHQSCTSILVLWMTGEDLMISNGSLLCIEIDRLGQGGGNIIWQESHNSREVKRTTNLVDQF